MKSLLTGAHGAALISVLGLMVLSFLGGAAVMHFGLLSSQYLRGAFKGTSELFQPTTGPSLSYDLAKAGVSVDKARATYDGVTLVSTNSCAEAMLIDMRGTVLHRWKMPERCPWEPAPDVRPPDDDQSICWQRTHVFANGDVLALCSTGGSPYGYGLVKLDKDSNVLWGWSGNVHHDFDVAEDGRIYVLTQTRITESPEGLDWVPVPCKMDHLVILSADGKQEADIDILAAFRKSPYLLTVVPSASALAPGVPGLPRPPHGVSPPIPGQPPPPGQPPFPGGPPVPGAPFGGGLMTPPPVAPEDFLHTNGVTVLSRKLASKFPSFKAGQVLISMRGPSTLAVLDVPTRAVAWAAKGVWQYQHDAQFLDNGRILLFDNFGSAQGSRVIEYDPITGAIPWWYGGDAKSCFQSPFRGATQRLPNGNTLIVVSDQLKVLEVSGDREVVWQWAIPAPVEKLQKEILSITGVWRYAASELAFLKAKARPNTDSH